MNLVETYGPHLAFLRRFSRALTGDQVSGDAYVRSTLEALAGGQVVVDEGRDPKISLYKMFLGIWNSSGATLEGGQGSDAGNQDRLQKLTPLPRQAFLLHSMEGFLFSDIAKIMDMPEASVTAHIAEAEATIDKELRTNVLIIEDEAFIAADIEDLVNDLGHTVDHIAATQSEAVAAVKAKKPGLVLADVQLADGSSGIDAVADILELYSDVPVIFITAFPERLLTGERAEPAYLISKPFDQANVKAAISQALFFARAGTSKS